MNEQQTEMPVVANINLDPPGAPKRKTDSRIKQTETGLGLREPFTILDLQNAAGLSHGGASSQMRRWLYWNWVRRSGFGQYMRTELFGQERERTWGGKRKKASGERFTSKGYRVNAQLACDIPGCGYIGYGSTEKNAQRSLGRHKSMTHGIKKTYVPVGLRAKLGLNVHTKYAIPRQIPSQNGTAQQAAPAPAPAPEFHLKYCPECGYNIQMHEVSYRIARKHRKD